jgi:hypothetical protein
VGVEGNVDPSSRVGEVVTTCSASSAEGGRIERLIQRDGIEPAKAWARRTYGIYRSEVLNPKSFAHAGEYRRRFIESCLALKRFALQDARALRSGEPTS